MTFNDESLARAVAASPVPVVTGIGHEPDNSICDMVSDRRCSTPTAAAESVAPEFAELVNVLNMREQRLQRSLVSLTASADAECEGMLGRISRAMSMRLERLALEVDGYASRPCLVDPTNVVDRRRAELAQTADRFAVVCDRSQERFTGALDRLAPRLEASVSGLGVKRHALDLYTSKLRAKGSIILSGPVADLGKNAAALDALSPLKVLGRGYSIAYDGAGRVATSVDVFAPGDEVRVRMADGEVSASVRNITHAGK